MEINREHKEILGIFWCKRFVQQQLITQAIIKQFGLSYFWKKFTENAKNKK